MKNAPNNVERTAKQALLQSRILLVGVLISLILNVLHAQYISTINGFVAKDADELYRLREQVHDQHLRLQELEDAGLGHLLKAEETE